MEDNQHSCAPLEYKSNEIISLKNDISTIVEQKTRGAIARSQANWMEGGQKNPLDIS